MTCPDCKQSVAPAHRYCPWCGTPLKTTTEKLRAKDTREYLLNLGDPRLA